MLNLSPEMAQYGFWDKLKKLSFVEGIYLFGSRAKGNASVKSDIDIAIDCAHAQEADWQQVLDVIEEADTLLMVDIVRYDALKEESLLRHNIDKDRWVVYEK